MIIGAWRDHSNCLRPHSALGYRPPAPVTLEALHASYPHPRSCSRLSIRLFQNPGQISIRSNGHLRMEFTPPLIEQDMDSSK